MIRGQPRQGPPPERTLALSNITAPKMARRGKPGDETSTETKDEVGRGVCVCVCAYMYGLSLPSKYILRTPLGPFYMP